VVEGVGVGVERRVHRLGARDHRLQKLDRGQLPGLEQRERLARRDVAQVFAAAAHRSLPIPITAPMIAPSRALSRLEGVGVVAAAFVLMFALGSLYAWSVFVDPLERELNVSRSTINIVYSLTTTCFTLTMFVVPMSFGRTTPQCLAVATCILT